MKIKNLLMPLFLMGCFPVDFHEVKRPLRTKSVKRPIKVGKRPINEGKRPIKAKVLVGVSVGSLMGCFRAPPPWRKTAPLKRPVKRSMRKPERGYVRMFPRNENRNEGTFAKTTLLWNHPFCLPVILVGKRQVGRHFQRQFGRG